MPPQPSTAHVCTATLSLCTVLALMGVSALREAPPPPPPPPPILYPPPPPPAVDARWVSIPPKVLRGVYRAPFVMLLRDDLGRCMFGHFCDLYTSNRDDDPHVEEFFFAARAKLGPGRVALDVGSNIGHKSLTLNALGFYTVSIEPQKPLHALHARSHAANTFPHVQGARNVLIHGVVGSTRTTTMWMPGHTSAEWPQKFIDMKETVKVASIAFDLLKVDIDGYECFILRDLRPPMIVEVTLKLWKAKCGFEPGPQHLRFAVGAWLVGNHPMNTGRGLLVGSNSTRIMDGEFVRALIRLGKTFSVARL